MNFSKITGLFKGLLKKSDGNLKELIKKLAEDPNNLRLKLQIGKEYFRRKDLDQGIAIYQEVAEAYTQNKFHLKAIAVYKEILKYSPSSVEFNEKLGDLLIKVGIVPDAIQQYQIAIHYYQSHNEMETALKLRQKIVKADPKNVQQRIRLAENYFTQRMEEESLAEYERVARQLRKEMKQLDVLTEVYEKILLKKPDELGLLRELCIFYLKLKNPQKAIRKIERRQLENDKDFKPIYDKAHQLKELLEKK